jgi:DNA-binding GntR family transcriptional regulator
MRIGRGAAPRDLGMEAYTRLRDAIRDGTLVPGNRITETDLSDYLKMSRTPVREAIYRLESDGLLTHEPRFGLTVTRPGHRMMMELYTMRETLEGMAARLAAQHASEAEIETLRDIIAMEPTLFGDAVAMRHVNQRVHRLISLAAHNRYLLRSLDIMSTTILLLPTVLGDADLDRLIHEEHLAIAGAIAGRDAEAAEAAARRHIRLSRKRRLMLMVLADGGADRAQPQPDAVP